MILRVVLFLIYVGLNFLQEKLSLRMFYYLIVLYIIFYYSS